MTLTGFYPACKQGNLSASFLPSILWAPLKFKMPLHLLREGRTFSSSVERNKEGEVWLRSGGRKSSSRSCKKKRRTLLYQGGGWGVWVSSLRKVHLLPAALAWFSPCPPPQTPHIFGKIKVSPLILQGLLIAGGDRPSCTLELETMLSSCRRPGLAKGGSQPVHRICRTNRSLELWSLFFCLFIFKLAPLRPLLPPDRQWPGSSRRSSPHVYLTRSSLPSSQAPLWLQSFEPRAGAWEMSP